MEDHRTVKIDKISFAKEHSFKILNIFIIICVAQLCLNRVFSMDFINSQPSISNHAGCHNISFI